MVHVNVLFIALYRVVTLGLVGANYICIKQYFPMVLFIMLYKVVLTFESVDEIIRCDHSDESY